MLFLYTCFQVGICLKSPVGYHVLAFLLDHIVTRTNCYYFFKKILSQSAKQTVANFTFHLVKMRLLLLLATLAALCRGLPQGGYGGGGGHGGGGGGKVVQVVKCKVIVDVEHVDSTDTVCQTKHESVSFWDGKNRILPDQLKAQGNFGMPHRQNIAMTCHVRHGTCYFAVGHPVFQAKIRCHNMSSSMSCGLVGHPVFPN